MAEDTEDDKKKYQELLDIEANHYAPEKRNRRGFSDSINDQSAFAKMTTELQKRSKESPESYIDYSDYVFVYPDYKVDSKVPKVARQSGLTLDKDVSVYEVSLDRDTFMPNARLVEDLSQTRAATAEGMYDGSSVAINDVVVMMKKDDYNKGAEISQNLSSMNESERQTYISTLDSAALQSFLVYTQGMELHNATKAENNKQATFDHELHHFDTLTALEARRDDVNSGSISIADEYKLQIHIEQSARIKEDVNAVNRYLKAGNYDDLSSFPPDSQWLIDKLEPLSPEERKNLAGNLGYVINGSAENFKNERMSEYDQPGGQFEESVVDYAENAPALKINEDANEYAVQRSLLYSMDVYNPETKKTEKKDLSGLLNEDVKIGESKGNFIRIQEAKARKRQVELKSLGITPEVVNKTKEDRKTRGTKHIKKHYDRAMSVVSDNKIQQEFKNRKAASH